MTDLLPFSAGSFCRLVHATSLLQNATSLLTFEFTTPRPGIPTPQGVLACLTADGQQSHGNASAALVSLAAGGTQFALTETAQLAAGARVADSAFFSAASVFWDVRGAQACSVYDVLSTDAYYAESYVSRKFEQLGGVARQPPAPAARGTETGGNCLLLTGAWAAGERYEAVINTTNPAPAGAEIGLWLGMIEYSKVPRPGDAAGADLSFLVRGPKLGAACAPHAALPAPLRVMNATEFAAAGWPPAPPATLAPADAPLCRDGFAPSLRYGGECVDCGSEAYSGAACACRADQLGMPAGGVACANVTVAGAPTAAALLPSALCAAFTAQRESFVAGALSANLVIASFVERFFALAASFLDMQDLLRANATYAATELYDDRRPADPSRRTGVGPVCAACEGVRQATYPSGGGSWIVSPFGTFVDYKTGAVARVRDRQFLAAHVLRFIGYVLHTVAGQTCAGLYVPGATEDIFGGAWTDNVCSAR